MDMSGKRKVGTRDLIEVRIVKIGDWLNKSYSRGGCMIDYGFTRKITF